MQLIDANLFRKNLVDRQITTQFFNPERRHEIGCIIDMLDNVPTIDPENLRPQSEWIEADDGILIGTGKHLECKNCGIWKKDRQRSNYCPNCGVKMKNT